MDYNYYISEVISELSTISILRMQLFSKVLACRAASLFRNKIILIKSHETLKNIQSSENGWLPQKKKIILSSVNLKSYEFLRLYYFVFWKVICFFIQDLKIWKQNKFIYLFFYCELHAAGGLYIHWTSIPYCLVFHCL